jgi:outer membrane protein OmpA-like peptidoglycan-associated protein
MATSSVKIPDAMVPVVAGNVAHLRVLMDGAYFKMYVNERRLYNVPELAFRRDSVIRVLLGGAEEDGMGVYPTSIRVAESETDVLYDALAAKGRWATQGILFATGRADLQPESRPVLKEIAKTLEEHADLKILTALVADFGASGDRITTKGFGDTKPAVPNATPAGRAQNRRVEIVKR